MLRCAVQPLVRSPVAAKPAGGEGDMNIKELLIGGVAGAALAVVATQYLGGAQAALSAAPTSVAAAPAATVAPAPAASPSPLLAASAAAVASPGIAPANMPATGAAAVASPPAVAAVDARKAAPVAVAAAAMQAVDVPAVSLSAEHAKMLLSQDQQRPSLPELHARFAGEPVDLARSQPLEAQLRQALQDAGVQKTFEVLAVECRRTLCELRLFGNGADAGRRWDAIAAQLTQQPWWSQNVSGSTMSTAVFNDRAVIAAVLQRARH